jgi:hypothetical protein
VYIKGMFHWICPECGREIPPAVKECPVCDPQISDVSSVNLASIPVQESSGKSLSEPAAAAVAPPVLIRAEPLITPALTEPVLVPDPVLRLAVRLGAAVPVPEPEPVLVAVAAPESKQAAEQNAAEQSAAEQTNLAPDPVLRLTLRARPPETPAPVSPPELPGLGELAAAVESAGETETARELQPSAPLPSLEPHWQARQIEAPAAVALLAAPVAPPPVPEPVAAASVPSAEFTALPPAALATPAPIPLPVPIPGVSGKPEAGKAFARPAPVLPLAALQDYTPAALRKIRPVPPRAAVKIVDGLPRNTVPSPALPPQLLSLRNAGIATVTSKRPKPPKRPTPGWLVTAMVTIVLLGIGVTAVFTLMPRVTASDPAPSAPAPTTATAKPVALKPVEAAAAPYPLAKAVEVTGIRFSTDASKKPEVHYIVVNHSSTGLEDATVYVTLRASGAKPGQPPLSKFSFHAPNLGPLEAKEMTSPIDKLPRPGSVPEWQELRADVELGQ